MSIEYWKSTLTPRPDLVDVLAPLIELSKRRQKMLTIFDLEATTFMGRHNFGITDVGMVHINPRGSVATSGSLVNPENKIDPEVVKLTGIRQDMLTHQHNWKHGWGAAWSFLAREHIVMGFNSSTFDKPALVSQHARYGLDPLEFNEHWDVRNLYKAAAKTQKGKLEEVANWLGIDTSSFKGHRAINDAILTAVIMANLWEKFPEHHAKLDSTLVPAPAKNAPAVPLKNPLKTTVSRRTISEAKSQAERLRESVLAYYQHPARPASFDDSDLSAILKSITDSPSEQELLKKSLSFAISSILDKGELPVLRPGNTEKLEKLREKLQDQAFSDHVSRLWKNGERLAPVHAYLQEQLNQDINYIDVRWVLHTCGARPLKSMVIDNVHP